MSPVLSEFAETLGPKVRGVLVGTAKVVIKNEGAVFLSQDGASLTDDPADVTLIASEQTFRNILSGDQNPAMAFMTGKLKVEGSNMRALKVSDILTS